MKNEGVKKSLEKSQNVLEEKRKIVKQKISLKKRNTFTIIAMEFDQEQLEILNKQIRSRKNIKKLSLQKLNRPKISIAKKYQQGLDTC